MFGHTMHSVSSSHAINGQMLVSQLINLTILMAMLIPPLARTQDLQANLQDINITWAQQSNLTCFSCSLDFRYTAWDGLNDCLGMTAAVNNMYLVACGIHEVYCQENFVTQSGVLLTLSRSCSSTCYHYCKSNGFGVTRSTCNLCCSQDGCNNNGPDLGV